jgi:hypothetical protein
MPPLPHTPDERRPILLIALGRQRVGKTSFLNAAAQFLQRHGARPRIWNADKLTRSSTLSLFHDDVLEPSSDDPRRIKTWLEERCTDLIHNRNDAILDIGGGPMPLAWLSQDSTIVAALEQGGIRLVLVHVVGPERADFDCLETLLHDGPQPPPATVIVMNAGLILTGRSAEAAFSTVRSHPALIEALRQGAQVMLMPCLPCLSAVTDRGLTFEEAMSGVVKPGHAGLSFFDRERVYIWWERELTPFFKAFPPLWLPAHEPEPGAPPP